MTTKYYSATLARYSGPVIEVESKIREALATLERQLVGALETRPLEQIVRLLDEVSRDANDCVGHTLHTSTIIKALLDRFRLKMKNRCGVNVYWLWHNDYTTRIMLYARIVSINDGTEKAAHT